MKDRRCQAITEVLPRQRLLVYFLAAALNNIIKFYLGTPATIIIYINALSVATLLIQLRHYDLYYDQYKVVIQTTNQRRRTSSWSCDIPPWSQRQSTQVVDTGQDPRLLGSGSQSAMESDTRDGKHPLSQRSRTQHQLYLHTQK